MALRITETVFDDLTGQPGSDLETVTLTYNGVQYQLDLSEDSRGKLDEALAPFLTFTQGTSLSALVSKMKDREMGKVIRKWAKDNGFTVGSRGRIAAAVHDAFRKASVKVV